MRLDDALSAIRRVAREHVAVGPDEPSTALDDAVRYVALHDAAALWQLFLPFVQSILDRRGDTLGVERVMRALFRICIAHVPTLAAEPRLIDLAARLRHHDPVAASARDVLATVEVASAVAAIERYPHVPAVARAPLPAGSDFLARYLGGERGVWNELVAEALAVTQHPELTDEAHAVAMEMMKRVRHNVDAVRAALGELGASVRADPAPASADDLARFVAEVGPLPISLDAYWRTVGTIDLCGPADVIEGIALADLDPLEVRGLDAIDPQLADYRARIAASHREIVGPLELALARDKRVALPPPTPADAVDPRSLQPRHRMRFVEYLRHAFRWGGFADLKHDHGPEGERLLGRLRRDLVDF